MKIEGVILHTSGYSLKINFLISGYSLIFALNNSGYSLMKQLQQQLILNQMEKKLSVLAPLGNTVVPQRGWVYAIRVALKMSLRQLGNRLSISAQSVKEMEDREAAGSISINALQEAADALDMKLVYGFVPKHSSIEAMIEKQAQEVAREIVMRASVTMKLEDQGVSDARIEQSIKNKAAQLIEKMPRYLWD